MPAAAAWPELAEILLRGALDLLCVVLLQFGIYLPRYHDRTLVSVATLFNVFVFVLLSVLSTAQFSVTAGFGLFAVLALFTLRSEPIGRLQIAYFFGSVALAVICSVRSTSILQAAVLAWVLLLCAWVFDHPRLLRRLQSVSLTLDRVDPRTLSDPAVLSEELTRRLGVSVMGVQVVAMDYANDVVKVDVAYRRP